MKITHEHGKPVIIETITTTAAGDHIVNFDGAVDVLTAWLDTVDDEHRGWEPVDDSGEPTALALAHLNPGALHCIGISFWRLFSCPEDGYTGFKPYYSLREFPFPLTVEPLDDSELIVEHATPPCQLCNLGGTVSIPASAVALLDAGVPVHDALPDMPRSVREQIITGTHGSCWTQMFGV
ncbi:hypothetical protein [Clavibacter michiganensis]|uniref:hypothetical protein n=1 Tax=Clavibacter michiganensis TaxID=28447 RepID=UPI00345B85DA